MAALRMKDFQQGRPIALALNELEPKEAPDNGYGPAFVFRSNQGSVYLTPDAAREVLDEIRSLGIQPGEPIRIGRQGTRFTVERDHSSSARIATALGGNGYGNGHGGYANGNNGHALPPAPPVPAPAPAPVEVPTKLMACFMQAIDAVAEAQIYADRRNLKVTFTSEDVRATAISCWIQCSREGR
jgi:hypothetical protein